MPLTIPDIPREALLASLPFALLALGGTVVALLGAWRSRWGVWAAFIALLAAGASLSPHLGAPSSLHFWDGALLADRFGAFLTLLLLAAGIHTLFLSETVLRREGKVRAEYYALLLYALSGMVLLVSTTNLLLLFLALELTSIPLYVLCGFHRGDSKGGEAALKYFLLGSFSSAILLFGAALLYGATGELDLAAMRGGGALGAAGLLLVLTGLFFKAAVVPFHMWAPDAYDGAPTPITSFMATAVKVASFGVLIRVFSSAGGVGPAAGLMGRPASEGMLFWLAVLTMTVGNLCALTQNNIKRMLAYSSIAHAGYALIGLVPGSGGPDAAGVLYYLTAYLLMTGGAFAVVTVLSRRDRWGETVQIDRFAGVGYRAPFLGAAMTVFLVSLGGIPPTAGFFGKYLIFRGALDRGLTALVVIAVLNSAASLYYYLRVVVFFYMRSTDRPAEIDPSRALRFIAVVGLVLVLWFGFGPDLGGVPGVPSLLGWIESAAASLP
ncbi:MAG: NADH-quinone oxidoreductase subunit N [Candidatus Eisenbacteria bacterium]|nr:NADH-quinone oxidoreductase subunit N [Candidatus Eisenbacteria bacterium]